VRSRRGGDKLDSLVGGRLCDKREDSHIARIHISGFRARSRGKLIDEPLRSGGLSCGIPFAHVGFGKFKHSALVLE